MKIQSYTYPKSSFLSIEKDTQFIIDKMLSNERLKRLLYYTTPDALSRPNLTEDETYNLLKEHKVRLEDNSVVTIPALIKFVPKVYVDEAQVSYIIVTFERFLPGINNPEFRDFKIRFDIICHYDLWQLNDMQLRPYKIAAEIDSMFNEARLSGIGTLQFSSAETVDVHQRAFSGISLLYTATHGNDDQQWHDHKYHRPAADADLEENYLNTLIQE